MSEPGYEKLAEVLQRAFEQASAGKGKERHASAGVPFEDQPMSSINRTLGSIDGFLYQAAKKAAEARRLPAGRAQAELLGAINYLAGAYIALDSWAADTLPGVAPAAPAGLELPWIVWHGGPMPVEAGTRVFVKYRNGTSGFDTAGRAGGSAEFWEHGGDGADIVAYQVLPNGL